MNKTKLKPLFDYVIFEEIVETTGKTKGGIILLDSKDEDVQDILKKGLVKSIGSECKVIKAGDKILYHELTIKDEGGVKRVHERDIRAIIKK